MMGDILRSTDDAMEFTVEAVASAPIERLEIRNGLQVLETWRPYDEAALGRRIRVIWEGSEYRGRGRQTIWDGGCTLQGNTFERVAPINLWNLDKKLTRTGPAALSWEALTTGGFGGFDAWLADAQSGTLHIDTALVKCEIAVADIGLNDLVFEAGGLRRRIRVFRLPDASPHRRLHLSRRIPLKRRGDNAVYICLTQEDGHLAWSSPIYLFPGFKCQPACVNDQAGARTFDRDTAPTAPRRRRVARPLKLTRRWLDQLDDLRHGDRDRRAGSKPRAHEIWSFGYHGDRDARHGPAVADNEVIVGP